MAIYVTTRILYYTYIYTYTTSLGGSHAYATLTVRLRSVALKLTMGHFLLNLRRYGELVLAASTSLASSELREDGSTSHARWGSMKGRVTSEGVCLLRRAQRPSMGLPYVAACG